MISPQQLEALNGEQRSAVLHPSGPALVIAGAGSGKTRVLTYRIAHLISSNVPARQILAVTFTNKAAGEMKRRVEAICGAQPDLWIGTFHAMCARLLRVEIVGLGMQPNFSIVDAQDSLTVIKEVSRHLNIDENIHRPNSLREQISKAKNRLKTPQQIGQEGSDAGQDILAQVYREYQKRLFINNSLDFDDLLMGTVKLFQRDPFILSKYQTRFQHVLIDEYQDTNHTQYVLIRLLAGASQNIFAVGDEDQSIYRFRGAEIGNILDFDQDFPNTTLYKLQQNYRSTQRILDGANALICHNRERKGKVLWTQNSQGEMIQAFHGRDEREEVSMILRSVEAAHGTENISLKDIVIFYRIHALSRVLEEGLRQRGIPYAIVGGVGFYERKEVKDALAYLRILVCPSDTISLKRILNVPSRGIGASTVKMLSELALKGSLTVLQTLEQALRQGMLKRKAHQGITNITRLMKEGSVQITQGEISEVLQWVMEESGYMSNLRNTDTIEARTRLENLKELISATEEFHEDNPKATLADFLDSVALWTNMDRYEDTDEKVTLMTLHSSKGLEYSHVFIAGLEEGIFPYSYWGMDAGDLEEERRLLYVGMTRARKRLYLSCVANRMLFGTRKALEPSRFLGELKGEFLQTFSTTSRIDSLYDQGDEDLSRIPAEAPTRLDHLNTTLPIENFTSGEHITHPKFGPGKIIGCYDEGTNQKVSIRFHSEEHPRLLVVKYAKLRRL